MNELPVDMLCTILAYASKSESNIECNDENIENLNAIVTDKKFRALQNVNSLFRNQLQEKALTLCKSFYFNPKKLYQRVNVVRIFYLSRDSLVAVGLENLNLKSRVRCENLLNSSTLESIALKGITISLDYFDILNAMSQIKHIELEDCSFKLKKDNDYNKTSLKFLEKNLIQPTELRNLRLQNINLSNPEKEELLKLLIAKPLNELQLKGFDCAYLTENHGSLLKILDKKELNVLTIDLADCPGPYKQKKFQYKPRDPHLKLCLVTNPQKPVTMDLALMSIESALNLSFIEHLSIAGLQKEVQDGPSFHVDERSINRTVTELSLSECSYSENFLSFLFGSLPACNSLVFNRCREGLELHMQVVHSNIEMLTLINHNQWEEGNPIRMEFPYLKSLCVIDSMFSVEELARYVDISDLLQNVYIENCSEIKEHFFDALALMKVLFKKNALFEFFTFKTNDREGFYDLKLTLDLWCKSLQFCGIDFWADLILDEENFSITVRPKEYTDRHDSNK